MADKLHVKRHLLILKKLVLKSLNIFEVILIFFSIDPNPTLHLMALFKIIVLFNLA